MSDKSARVTIRQEVTEEIEWIFRSVVNYFHPDGEVDWDDVLERMNGRQLEDGRWLNLGLDTNTPAFRALRLMIAKERGE